MGYYKNKIKVIGLGMMCWPIDPKSLEALACSSYDPYALTDPDLDPVETISVYEWYQRQRERDPNTVLTAVL